MENASTTNAFVLNATTTNATSTNSFSTTDIGLPAGLAERQPDDERAALAQARAAGLDATMVQLDERPHQAQADAQPPCGAIEAAVGLGEKVEHVRQHVCRDPHPAVPHPQHRRAVRGLERQLDVPAWLGLLH